MEFSHNVCASFSPLTLSNAATLTLLLGPIFVLFVVSPLCSLSLNTAGEALDSTSAGEVPAASARVVIGRSCCCDLLSWWC